jgi:hypothetical protein
MNVRAIGNPRAPIYDYLRRADLAPTDPASVQMAVAGGTLAAPLVFRHTAQRISELVRVTITALGAKEVVDGFFDQTALTNGIQIVLRKLNEGPGGTDYVEMFGTDVVPVTHHQDFGIMAGTDVSSDSTGNASRYSIRWTIAKTGATYKMDPGDSLAFLIRDDLSSVSEMRAMVQGF